MRMLDDIEDKDNNFELSDHGAERYRKDISRK